MSEIRVEPILKSKIAQRTAVLFDEQQNAVYRRTDALFGKLLVLQWLAGILVAMTISPRVWSGSQSEVHIHVWTAIILGAVIIALPVYLAHSKPGAAITRHSIAVGQMLYSALLIHLTGGRIETHFHIFGSLAFLSFYRDWRVLISASLVVMADHILRGLYLPQSIYGVSGIEPFRWLEHTWWVVFEDVFLFICCLQNIKEMMVIACRQAEVEETRDNVEEVVTVRTKELSASEQRLATQYAVTSSLTEAATLGQATPKIMESIVKGLLPKSGLVAGLIWTIDKRSGHLRRLGQLKFSSVRETPPTVLTTKEANELVRHRLALRVGTKLSVLQIENLDSEILCLDPGTGLDVPLKSAFALAFIADDQMQGVIEMFAHETIKLDGAEVSMLESLGQQLADCAVKMQVQSENRQLADMVKWSKDAIIGQTVDGIITSWNGGAQALFGYAAEEVIGKHASIICPQDQSAALEQFIALGRRGQIVEGIESQRLTKEGKTVDISLTRSPVFDDHQNVVGISAVMHNITERKEADKKVSEFYSIVSHELRTPLTSVRGVLGLIEGGVVEAGSDEAAELLTVARESTDRLIRLINDMLDLKKIESGKMQMHCRSLSAEDLVGDCLDSLKGMSEAASVKLHSNLTYTGMVFADRDKTTQILTNLISNAIKFSPRGSNINVFTEAGSNGMVRFKIVDNGPGISECDQEKLFEKFQQLDSSDTRQQGGTGLGLAICKALIEGLSGDIGLESAVGQGSTFWFDLPATEADVLMANELKEQQKVTTDMVRLALPTQNSSASTAVKNNNHNESGKSILIVEDDLNLARVLTAHFRHTGYGTVVAGSLKQARACLNTATFSAVVLDLGLPDGNGLDLLHEIKSSERTTVMPVIIITGQSLDDNEIDSSSASDWLAKPFHGSALIKIIDRLCASNDLHDVLANERDRELEGISLSSSNILSGMEIRSAGGSAESKYIPVVIYSDKIPTAGEQSPLETNTNNDSAQNDTGQSDLIDAMSLLLGGT